MGIIQGFYKILAYADLLNVSRYYSDIISHLYFSSVGSPLVMRTGDNDARNSRAWMLFQPDDEVEENVRIISASNVIKVEDGSSTPYTSTCYKELKLIADGSIGEENLYFICNSVDGEVHTSQDHIITASYANPNTSVFKKEKISTKTIDGVECDIVSFKVIDTESPYYGKYIDSTGALASQGGDLSYADYTGGYFQQFCLLPCDPYDPDLVSPKDVSITRNTSEVNMLPQDWYYLNYPEENITGYPCWIDSASTINNNCDYNVALRFGEMANDDTWKKTDWETASLSPEQIITTSSFNRIGNFGRTFPAVSTSIKQVSAEVTVQPKRTLSVLSATIDFVAEKASGSVRLAKPAHVLIETIAWTPEGMKLNFANDYFGQGATTITITSISTTGTLSSGIPITVQFLSKEFETTIVKDTAVTIPFEYFSKPPKNGKNVNVRMIVDTDVYAPHTNSQRHGLDVIYDSGTVDVKPFLTIIDNLRYEAIVPYANDVRMWMSVDGSLYELTGVVEDGKTKFEVIPPSGTEYGLFTVYENSDLTEWGTNYYDRPKMEHKAHIFTWDDGACIIWLNKDAPLNESFSFDTYSTTHTFAGRQHDVVSYLTDGSKNFTSVSGEVSGYIYPDIKCPDYGTTCEDIEAMVEQGHVLYRSPFGRVCNVAVTGASITTERGITEVKINIIEEDV